MARHKSPCRLCEKPKETIKALLRRLEYASTFLDNFETEDDDGFKINDYCSVWKNLNLVFKWKGALRARLLNSNLLVPCKIQHYFFIYMYNNNE